MNEFSRSSPEGSDAEALQRQWETLSSLPDDTAVVGIDPSIDDTSPDTAANAEAGRQHGNPWEQPLDETVLEAQRAVRSDAEALAAEAVVEAPAEDEATELVVAPPGTGIFTPSIVLEQPDRTTPPAVAVVSDPPFDAPKRLPVPRQFPQHKLEDFSDELPVNPGRRRDEFNSNHDAAIEKYPLFVDRGEHDEPALHLEKATPSHIWQANIKRLGDGTRYLIVTQADLTTGETIRKDYMANARGVRCYEGLSVGRTRSFMPKPGEIPEADRRKLYDDEAVANKPNQELEKQMGLQRWRPVGEQESDFVAEIVREGRPPGLALSGLHAVSIARGGSRHLPSEAVARQANADYTANTYAFLKSRGYDPLSGEEFETRRLLFAPVGVSEVAVGVGRNDDGLLVPYTHISGERPVSGERFTRLLEQTGYGYHLGHLREGILSTQYLYRERDGLLMGEIRSSLADSDGQHIGICAATPRFTCDALEVRMLRSFVWYPRL